MNKTALVFGSKGQDGSFICKSLLEKNYKVIGVSRSKNNISNNHQLLDIQKNIIEKFNVGDSEFEIFTAIRKWKDNF